MVKSVSYLFLLIICACVFLFHSISGQEKALSDIDLGTSPSNNREEQARINTIISAFKKLPESELATLGVNIHNPIQPGTKEAALLDKAWEKRQEEFKKAMASALKPVDYMNVLLSILKNDTITPDHDQVIYSLKELEYVLSDMDNTKDFYTIGGWPILVNRLSPKRKDGSNRNIEERMYAAWVIGTAVKNMYDYQLWIKEPIIVTDEVTGAGNEKSALTYLIECLLEPVSSITDGLHRKALYAIASAARGNVDIQDAILKFQLDNLNNFPHNAISSFVTPPINFMKIITSLSLQNNTSFYITRKTYAMASDMLQEKKYIRELLSSNAAFTTDAVDEILSHEFLGDVFCTDEFAKHTIYVLQKFIDNSVYLLRAYSDDSVSKEKLGYVLSIPLENPALLNVYKATLNSIIETLGHQLLQCPESFEKVYESTATESTSSTSSSLLAYSASKYPSYLYIEGLLYRISRLRNNAYTANPKAIDNDSQSLLYSTSSKASSFTEGNQDDEDTEDKAEKEAIKNSITFSNVLIQSNENMKILQAYMKKRNAIEKAEGETAMSTTLGVALATTTTGGSSNGDKDGEL